MRCSDSNVRMLLLRCLVVCGGVHGHFGRADVVSVRELKCAWAGIDRACHVQSCAGFTVVVSMQAGPFCDTQSTHGRMPRS